MANKYNRIFLHNSDSDFGTALMIREWHIDRKFRTIGYHSVVQNGYPNVDWYKNKIIIPYLEGAVEIGRQIDSDSIFTPDEMGAGVKGWNTGSYHICMIGKHKFSNKVLNSALDCVRFRANQFNIGFSNTEIMGHYEADNKKTCPDIDMNEFRKYLRNDTNYGQKVIVGLNERKEPIKDLTFSRFLKFFRTLIMRILNETKNQTAI